MASARSLGEKVAFGNKQIAVVSIEDAIEMKPAIALFSAGSSVSLEYAPRFSERGTYVIDNSSAWRMHEDVPLIVPEVNGHVLTPESRIIANPNCSTIQMVVAIGPLHNRWQIERLVISTYQSITGTGKDAVEQYEGERDGLEVQKVYPHRIFANCLPHCDVFMENDYTREEMKLVHETRKILGDDTLRITATAVRVPVLGGHSESVNVEFARDCSVADIRGALAHATGVVVQDDPSTNSYPMPISAADKDQVFVGRVRADESQDRAFNMWIVSDNLRKGAATNAVQIAQLLINEGFVRA